MKVGYIFGMIGALLAMIILCMNFQASVENMPSIGLNMLIAVMFFAAAGQAKVGKSSFLIGAGALAMSALAIIYSTMPDLAALVLMVLAFCIINSDKVTVTTSKTE